MRQKLKDRLVWPVALLFLTWACVSSLPTTLTPTLGLGVHRFDTAVENRGYSALRSATLQLPWALRRSGSELLQRLLRPEMRQVRRRPEPERHRLRSCRGHHSITGRGGLRYIFCWVFAHLLSAGRHQLEHVRQTRLLGRDVAASFRRESFGVPKL